MKNETSIDNSRPIINNSSMVTAENSSSLHSKFHIKRNEILSPKTEKYSNIALFENREKQLFNTISRSKNKNGLYLTDVTLSKYRETDFESKPTIESISNNYNSHKNLIKNRAKTKSHISSLPNLTSYSYKYITNPPCFTCCGNTRNSKFLTSLYNKQQEQNIYNNIINNMIKEKVINNNYSVKKSKKDKTFRDSKYEYIRKTNEIKRFKYELELKKEAIEDYKHNIKTQMCGIDHTINSIKSYRDTLENNFLAKYNKDLRKLERQLLDEKLSEDEDNRQLNILKKEVTYLKFLIVKKENMIKYIEKWLILQIYIKEGEQPKNLKNYLEKYNNKLIFETTDELDGALKFRENKNIRLMEKYNKSEIEKEKYRKQLEEYEKEAENIDQTVDILVPQKENMLKSLKKRESSLKATLNKIIKEKKRIENLNSSVNKKSKSTNNSLNNINNYKNNLNHDYYSELRKNELGIVYKPVKKKNNIFDYIECLYISIMCNDLEGLKIHSNLLHQLKGIGISNSKKAIIQMEIIEISLNYLISSIQKRVLSDKNNLLIKEKTCKIIDLYHKKINGRKNKLEQLNNMDRLLMIIKEKNNKSYYLPRGKIERYNIVAINKKKMEERLKNKKAKKKIDIWDFLYDQYNENEIKENENKADYK